MKDGQIKKVTHSEYRGHLIDQGFTEHELIGNFYGKILSWSEVNNKWIPITCQHGGSMWLCRDCADKIMKEENE